MEGPEPAWVYVRAEGSSRDHPPQEAARFRRTPGQVPRAARLLGDKLGPILFQLPPNWKCDATRLGDFLHHLPEDLVQVFEFRDQSWYCDPVFGLLREKNVGFCYSSLPGLACPLVATGPVVYARMHGVGVKYGGCYTGPQLRDLAVRLQDFLNLGYDVFVYFNNDALAYAVENAYDLRHLVLDMRRE